MSDMEGDAERRQKTTVLVVDDNLNNLQVLLEAMDNARFRVLVAPDGESALEQLSYSIPDVILLDVMMSGIDGFETCRRLKAEEFTRDIPVIFMTALSNTDDIVRGFELGGVDYIAKPIRIEEVLARIETHATIQRLRRRLQKEIALKDKFFSIIAHDLRTPLNGFLSFAKLLERFRELEPEQAEAFTKQFRESVESVFSLLENLLTWSRVQRGSIEWDPQPIEFGIIAQRNITLLKQNAVSKQIALLVTPLEACEVQADVAMLDTVVRNLLSNAIKFTNPGGVVELIWVANEAQITVTVSDSGIGMPEGYPEEIFEIGTKTQRKGTAGEQGSGLGLILCREFIKKHGGRIWLESAEGEGTRVSFTLPKTRRGVPRDEDLASV